MQEISCVFPNEILIDGGVSVISVIAIGNHEGKDAQKWKA